jgi:hypothetical protein
MRPSKARSELSVGLACHMRWVTYEGAVHLRPARHTPEVGAGCGKAARPVLCGGRIAICVPTAIRNPFQGDPAYDFLHSDRRFRSLRGQE